MEKIRKINNVLINWKQLWFKNGKKNSDAKNDKNS